jgi:zinc/manganese transport system substrate-binding protein
MKRITLISLLLFWIAPAQGALRIIATTPDLADLARQVGGEWVQVESLAKGTEDIHKVPQRPSFVPKLHRADGLVLVGLELEHSFLPALLEVAQNSRILPGAPGYIDCSLSVHPIDVPATLDRSQGELHPKGNPHYNIDPQNGQNIVDAIAAGLSRIDSAHQPAFEKNRDAFKQQLRSKMKEWEALAAFVKGVKAISYHRDQVYFARFMGLELVGEIEPKPGISPSPRHLETVAERMKKEGIRLIIHEAHYSDKTTSWLVRETGAKIAKVATMGGAYPGTETYIGLIDHNVRAVVDAVKGNP